MQLFELIHKIAYRGVPPLDAAVTLVTEDSSKVGPGSVFVCVEGAHADGHAHAREAIKKGAVCVVAQKETGAEPQILVEDTRRAYAQMCAAFFGHPAKKLTLIGITGTNGKTTTAFLLKQIFDRAGFCTGLIGTLTNMVGPKTREAVLTTPDPWTLHGLFAEMLAAGCTHCFMEVSSQALDQHRVEGVWFRAGVLSNLTQDHLDYHKTFENYFAAKQKLFRQCALGIVNLDDPAGPQMLKGSGARAVTYSVRNDQADYTAKNIRLQADGVAYELVSRRLIGRVRFGVPGLFSVYNSMAAACAALELGLSLPTVLEALGECTGVKGRMEVVPTEKDFTVLIDYAHTPDGLENILKALNETTQGRVICVFGCGGDRDKTKRPIMGQVAATYADIAVVTSDNPRSEDPNAIIADILTGVAKIKTRAQVIAEPDRRAAIAQALKKAKPGDTVVLAGKGQETYQILATGKIHMDEREIVREVLSPNPQAKAPDKEF
ncbi:MAG: UDP-N-acetylmuramoyl-L-alanyl-D-glutamate--2,6-diaminopimelate ligase [Oscillospiraceae bacterium]|jgi:UDP-N-acetylmuramoyl-L-alanyl-D-glutamate--2,6-diaminopimelate ligase|nr:UDP-N-acetylmuramoyl-L-alanyl-D-glutamate--2,6-diaminopimelate ligase [Oscillospiraceae bacterium]